MNTYEKRMIGRRVGERWWPRMNRKVVSQSSSISRCYIRPLLLFLLILARPRAFQSWWEKWIRHCFISFTVRVFGISVVLFLIVFGGSVGFLVLQINCPWWACRSTKLTKRNVDAAPDCLTLVTTYLGHLMWMGALRLEYTTDTKWERRMKKNFYM